MYIPLTFQLIFHILEHTHISTSAHPLQKQQELSLYHLRFLILPPPFEIYRYGPPQTMT